jgi:hypothetical protein
MKKTCHQQTFSPLIVVPDWIYMEIFCSNSQLFGSQNEIACGLEQGRSTILLIANQ